MYRLSGLWEPRSSSSSTSSSSLVHVQAASVTHLPAQTGGKLVRGLKLRNVGLSGDERFSEKEKEKREDYTAFKSSLLIKTQCLIWSVSWSRNERLFAIGVERELSQRLSDEVIQAVKLFSDQWFFHS